MSRVAQAGAIAIRRGRSGTEVLIARARKNPREWILPKGHIETGESAPDTAVRELQEETGVIGEIIAPVGVCVFSSNGREVEIEYFLMKSVGTGPSLESRQIQWVSFADAKQMITFPDARRLLNAAEQASGERRW